MAEGPARYDAPSCPRCEYRYCVTMRCEPTAPVKGCPSVTDCHTHAVCPRCGFEWICAGDVPPALRTQQQVEITIRAIFDAIVNGRGGAVH